MEYTKIQRGLHTLTTTTTAASRRSSEARTKSPPAAKPTTEAEFIIPVWTQGQMLVRVLRVSLAGAWTYIRKRFKLFQQRGEVCRELGVVCFLAVSTGKRTRDEPFPAPR